MLAELSAKQELLVVAIWLAGSLAFGLTLETAFYGLAKLMTRLLRHRPVEEAPPQVQFSIGRVILVGLGAGAPLGIAIILMTPVGHSVVPMSTVWVVVHLCMLGQLCVGLLVSLWPIRSASRLQRHVI